MGSIAAMQDAARRIDAANTGYDQSGRWTFFDRPTLQIIPNQEADCSSACAAIIALGGYPIDLGYPSHSGVYTGNFVDAAMKAGFTAHRYTGLDALRVGDFVVKPGAHVEFVAGPGTMFSALMDENGRAHGGSPGDQSGKEVRYTAAFNYPGGWTTVVRPPADSSNTIQKEGFLMALTDDQQAQLFGRIQNIQDILTGYAPNQYVKQGMNFKTVAQQSATNTMRVRDIKDYLSGGGPRGNDDTRLTEILAKLEGIEGRLTKIEGK